jgi:hypothetical protein
MKTEINSDPFIFRWKVSEAGYRWAKGMDGKPHLVPRLEPGKRIKPMDLPKTAFAEFARLDGTEEKIRGFADKYGDLFNTYRVQDHVVHGGVTSFGASLKTWQSAIEDVRVLVDLWDNIQNRRIAALKRVIRWEKTKDGDSSVSYLLKTSTRERDQMLAHSRLSEGALIRFADDKGTLLAARCALREEINLRLSEQPTVPCLAWTPDYDERIIFKPPHLLAAMWLQFAQAVTGEFGIKRCLCGKFIQTGPGGKRADVDTCSPACRQRKKRESRNNLALKRDTP